jgi:hypothetical protein
MTNLKKKHTPKSKAVKDLENLALQSLQRRYPNNPYPPQPKYQDNTSNGLTKCVIDFITLNGFQAERINSIGRSIDTTETVIDVIGRARQIGNVSWIKGSSTNGTADISSIILGRSIKIEIKCKATGDNYQSKDKIAYQKEIEAAGGVYVIARTFEGFKEWYQKFIENGK